jgi:hypothetical protein
MDETLRQEIESLRKLKCKELKLRYRQVFGEESPSSNQQHLFRRIAWRLQARSEGDLSERAKQRAVELAQDVDLRLRAPRRFWDQLKSANDVAESQRDDRLPRAGTIIERVYRGRSISVTVLDAGFSYDGKTYRSLSAIAYHVTGTRWNGFLFFQLTKGLAE